MPALAPRLASLARLRADSGPRSAQRGSRLTARPASGSPASCSDACRAACAISARTRSATAAQVLAYVVPRHRPLSGLPSRTACLRARAARRTRSACASRTTCAARGCSSSSASRSSMPHLVWLTGLDASSAFLAALAALVRRARRRAACRGRCTGSSRPSSATSAHADRVRLPSSANPFPGFVGREGSYPLDIAIDGPERSGGSCMLFRLLLALPALLLSSALWPSSSSSPSSAGSRALVDGPDAAGAARTSAPCRSATGAGEGLPARSSPPHSPRCLDAGEPSRRPVCPVPERERTGDLSRPARRAAVAAAWRAAAGRRRLVAARAASGARRSSRRPLAAAGRRRRGLRARSCRGRRAVRALPADRLAALAARAPRRRCGLWPGAAPRYTRESAAGPDRHRDAARHARPRRSPG